MTKRDWKIWLACAVCAALLCLAGCSRDPAVSSEATGDEDGDILWGVEPWEATRPQKTASSDGTTAEPPGTEPPSASLMTEPVEISTDPPTEAPTEPPTEAPTEPPTEAPTEALTEAPTEAPDKPLGPAAWDPFSGGPYGVEQRDLWLQRGDLAIYGRYYTPKNAEGPFPLIVFSHGYGGSYIVATFYAAKLTAAGFAVYCFDFCGGSDVSKSAGSAKDMSVLTEMEDLKVVLAAMTARPEIDPERVFLMGTSQGGLVSALVAAAEPNDFAGLVLLYPAFNIPDKMRTMYPVRDEIPDRVTAFSGFSVGRRYVEDVWDMDAYALVKSYKRPVLILHGDADPEVPFAYSERLVKAFPDATLLRVRGADHNFINEYFDGVMTQILSFLQEFY